MSMYYILKGHTPVPVWDVLFWTKYFGNIENRIVSQTMIKDVKVSTVFLGVDNSFGGNVPILFETMVFGGKLDQVQERYATWKEAEKGHKRMVKRVIEATK